MSIMSLGKNIIKKLVGFSGYELKPIGFRGLGYISAEATLKECKAKHITLNQYLEQIWGLDSHSKKIIKDLELINNLPHPPYNILEIGSGTGIYTDKIFKELGEENVELYQVYETASEWHEYLKYSYPVTLPFADGYQLSSTSDNSIQFVHAHGVFVYTNFITSMSYIKEMCRVTRAGGIVCFDAFDQSCFPDEIIDKWIASGDTYMNILPEEFILDSFIKNNFKLIKSFYIVFNPGKAKYYVFKKF